VRSSPALLFISSIVVLIGMWLERYVIIVSSLAQDYLPSSWAYLPGHPLGLGDLRGHHRTVPVPVLPVYPLLPMISIFEVRTLLPQAKVEEEAKS
jgi:hypothetical protein